MTLPEFTLAALGLLLTPGPTNTLLAIAGTERGWRPALRLIPFEICAYLLVTVPLALVGHAMMEAVPMLKPAITAAAGAWVMVLALKLWRIPAEGSGAEVSARRVFLTTVLNPKTLIFGLVLLPGPGVALRLGLFALLIGVVAAGWAALGSRAAARGPAEQAGPAPLIRRLAAVWLAFLAIGLLLNAAEAAHLVL